MLITLGLNILVQNVRQLFQFTLTGMSGKDASSWIHFIHESLSMKLKISNVNKNQLENTYDDVCET